MVECRDSKMSRMGHTEYNNRRDMITLLTDELAETNRVAVRAAQFKLVGVSEFIWAWDIDG
jgi:hypothetical protein